MKTLFKGVLLLAACSGLSASGQSVEPMTTLSLSAGQVHALAVRSDGTVWSWGTNRIGELGLGAVGQINAPRRIASLSNMTSVAAGTWHSLAVRSDGTLWSWGTNSNGQLGNGTTTSASAPVQVSTLTNALLSSAGANHSLAILKDGRLMAWGANSVGQLGLGNTISTNAPAQVGSQTNYIMVAAGSNFSLALTAAGEVWSWGTNSQGQLGLGHNNTQLSPTKISALSNIVRIAAGSSHALAMDKAGTVFGWGRNAEGQIGDGTTTAANVPKTVAEFGSTNSLGAARWIAAGFNSSSAVAGDAKLCYWGSYTNHTLFFGTVTRPTRIGVAVNEGFVSVTHGEHFLLVVETDRASVWAWGLNQYGQWGNSSPQTDDWRYENVNPSYAFGARPRPVLTRFTRGDRDNLNYNSFVLPLELEKGVRLNDEGGEQFCYGPTAPWFLRVQKSTRQHIFKRIGSTTNFTRFPVENPIAAFGADAGGRSLHVGRPYTFGLFAGAFNENTAPTNAIRVLVYDRAALASGATNVAPTNVFSIRLPRRTIAADNTLWSNYVTNGNRVLVETNGLRTSVEFSDSLNPVENWGVYFQFAITPGVVLGGYRITHAATSTNFCYVVEVQGQAEVGANVYAPVATTNTTTWAYAPLYALNFDEQPQWRVQFLDHPHFEGIPLPPAYAGRRVAELGGLTAAATNQVALTNNAAYLTLDSSPELRRHPVLDRFVEDMGRDPLALASYVINEVELTDPLGYVEAAQRVNDSIEIGGVNRSALGTFLEGQGSPTEQCALLVYLLRKAGYSAGYVFPTNNNLRLLDTTVSRLWQINVKGVQFSAGIPVITNSLIAANYPWVVANVGTNSVHIFPWLKNTELVEGADIYDYLPTNYFKAYPWVKDYVHATNVLGSASVNDPLMKTWRTYLTGVLNTNAQNANFSLDDFGVRAFNRRGNFSNWGELPLPNFLTNQAQLVVVPTLSESAVTYPFLTNMFDRVRVEVFKTDTNLVNRIFDTGEWRTCDLHNRKLLLYTNAATSATLWLAPYRPDATNATGNFTGFESGLGSLNKQVATATVASGVTQLPIRLTYSRRVSKLAQAGVWFPARELTQNSVDLTPLKRDVTAIIPAVGRVSSAMLRQHAEEYWRLEQQRALNPNFMPAVTDDAGTAGMLLASGFFENLWAEDQFNQRLHKVRAVTWYSAGMASLTRLANGAMQLKMGMNWFSTQVLGNGQEQQTAGDRTAQSLDNYLTFLQANGASTEHSIIYSMFKDEHAISSVRLLQLAAERARANGWAAPLELNIKNHVTLGNAAYTGYGATLLKNHDTAFWFRITNAFGTQSDKDFLRVLVTPGQVTNVTGSFDGLSALFFGKTQNGALVSDNDVVLNGGFSSANFAWIGAPTTPTFQLTYNLNYSPSFGYSFNYNNFSTPTPRYTFSHYDLVTITAPSGASQVIFTPHQTAQASMLTNSLNLAGQSTTNAIKIARDVGWLDRPMAFIKQAASKILDPVQVVSGDFYVDTVDLALAGPLPLEVRRNYLSRSLVDNQFGHGWKLGFTPWLVLSTNAGGTSIIHAAETDGAVLAYSFLSNNVWTVRAEHNPTLVNNTDDGIGSTANRFNNRIEKFTTNGTVYVLSSPDGSKRTYQEMNSFALTSGTNVLNRVRPYLTRWEDHAGNHHLFRYGTNSVENDFGQLNRVESANGATLVFKYDAFGRITEAFTDDNRRVVYAYDDYGDLVGVTLPDASKWEYEYQKYTFATNSQTYTDSNHLLVREVKPDGRVLVNAYDGLRRVITQAATVGTNRELVTNAWFFYTNNVTSLTNDLIHGYTRVEDVFRNAYHYHYTNNLITRIEEPLGRTNIQDWFEAGETNKAGYYPRSLELTISPRGLTNEFHYDAQGNVTNRVLRGELTGEGTSQTATNRFSYTNNLPASVTDPAGNRVAFFYEDAGDLFRPTRIEWSSGATGIATNRLSYTNVTQIVDMGGWFKTNRAYGLRSKLIRADTATNEWSFNGRGFPVQAVSHARTGDDPGNTDPAVTNHFVFNARGDLLEMRDGAGRRVRMNHDAAGRMQWRDVLNETGAALSRENFHYNRNGDLEWYDGPRSGPEDFVWFDYDGAGRLVQEVRWRSRALPDGSGVEAMPGDAQYAATHYRYDGFGNLTHMMDPRGAVTTNIWDALGRLVQRRSLDTNGTTLLATEGFAYEPGGLVRYHTNELGGVSERLYTATGQPRFQRLPDGSTNAWRYYLDGRLRRETQRNGAYWETTYDDASRKTTRIFYSAAGSPLATNSLELDRRGNVFRRTDAAGFSFTNSFDGLNRVKWGSGPVITYDPPEGAPAIPGGPPPPLKQAFTNYFDHSGIVFTNFNALGEKNVVFRDALGRTTRAEVRNATNLLVRETSVLYSADHHSTTVTHGSGTNAILTTMFTDTYGQPVLSVVYPSPDLREFTRSTYDAVGNLVAEARMSGDRNAVTTWTTAAFGYDGLNRLRSQVDRDGAQTSFEYDPAGNVTNRVMPGGLKWQAKFDAAGRMTEDKNVGSTGTSTRLNTYAYYATNHAFAGLLLTRTDSRSVVCTHVYDDWLRPLTNTYSGPLDEHDLATVWTYDTRGHLTGLTESFANSATGPATSLSRGFDPYGLQVNESTTIGGASIRSSSQSWDAAGRRRSLGFGTFGYNYTWRADGLIASSTGPTGGGSFTYDNAGQLLNRTYAVKSTSVTARDGAGRPTALSTTLNGSSLMTETMAWTPDGLIAAHTVTRPDYTDARSYNYAALTRRLTAEQVRVNSTTVWTNSFAYDAGVAAGPGVLTRLGQPATSGNAWKGGADTFSRLNNETNSMSRRAAYGRVNGRATVRVTLDGQPMPVTAIGTNAQTWHATLDLSPGGHTLVATAVHPSGLFTTNKTVTVTNNAADRVEVTYTSDGQLSQRVWKNAGGTTIRTQTLNWDAKGRLHQVTERDTANNGFNWSAVYDGFGRRLQTTSVVVTNNVAITALPKVITQYYDPLVEFLELGVTHDGRTTWKLYGPDLDGVYGGMNGTGGFDAIVPGPELFCPTISDARGNVHAVYDVTHGNLVWSPGRPTAYGAVPGYRPAPLAHGGSVVAASAWRGRWGDVTGLTWLGARYYNPESGSFLSADPVWNGGDPSYYTFAGGDPVNYFDPDGRFGKQAWDSTLYYGGIAVGTVAGMAHDIDTMAALGNPAHPRYVEVQTQMAIQGAEDYQNAGGGWSGTRNAFNRFNPVRAPFEAVSGMHMMEGPQLGVSLTWDESAVAWANTVSLAASLGAGGPGTMRAVSADLRALRPVAPSATPPPLPVRTPIPGDINFVGPVSRGWTLSPRGQGAHLFERVNVQGRPNLAALDTATTPRFYPAGTPETAGAAHLRLHQATKNAGIGLRRGSNSALTDSELMQKYRQAYSDPSLDGIRGDLRTPDGRRVIATDLTPAEAFEALQKWFSEQ